MGFAEKLKKIPGSSLIFESEESETPSEETQIEEVTVTPQLKPVVLQKQIPENDPVYAALYIAVMERDTPYARFLKTLKSLENVPMDANAKYIAAREVLRGNGVSPEQILQAINHHFAVLEAKKVEFGETAKDQKNSTVKSLETEYAGIERSIETSKTEIVRLQAEIAEQGKKKSALQVEIANQNAKIKEIADRFQAAVAVLHKKLEADRAKISSTGT